MPNNPLQKRKEEEFINNDPQYNFGGFVPPFAFVPVPSPTPSPTRTSTPTPTPTITTSKTPTPTPTKTNTPTPTSTTTPTPTPSPLVPSLTYITSLSNNTLSNSYSFIATSIGGPGLIVVAFQTERTTTLIQTPTITIGGVSATIAGDSYSGNNNPNTSTLIAYARITTGTTANISITYPASQTRIGIGVWRIQNNISDTPIQVQKSAANSGTGLSITLTGLTANNLGICAQTNGTQGTTMTWTNATEDYDYDIGSPAGTRISGASFITSSSGNRTITTSHTNSTQAITLLGVVWN